VKLLLGLLGIDLVVTAAFAFVPPREAPPPPEAPRKVEAPPGELTRRTAALVDGARRAARGKRVVVAPPRRSGDDLELRVSLARDVGFPAGLYCARCAAQRCLFPEATAQALDALAGAFPPGELDELRRVAAAELTYSGGASAGPVVKKDVAQSCDEGKPQTSIRFPAAYDVYDGKDCGARACTIGGERIAVSAGSIDDNRTLACLRAACLGEGATYIGEVAAEQGAAYRGAEAVLVIRGAGAVYDAVAASIKEEP
jgi:hypothetical protein